MAKHWYVYLITNTVNGKVYVGKAADVARRWNYHRRQTRSGQTTPLHRSMRKHGESAFRVEPMAGFWRESDAFEFERQKIAALRSQDRAIGYNITAGGEGCSGRPASPKFIEAARAWNRSEEAAAVRARAIRASAEARRGKPLSEAQRSALRDLMTGREFTPEWRQKISDAKRGIDNTTPEQRLAVSRANKGRKHTEDARTRIVAALRGRPVSEETRKKIQSGQPNMKMSDDDVVAVRNAYAAGARTMDLARRYGVTDTLISRIITGRARKLAGGPIGKRSSTGRG